MTNQDTCDCTEQYASIWCECPRGRAIIAEMDVWEKGYYIDPNGDYHGVLSGTGGNYPNPIRLAQQVIDHLISVNGVIRHKLPSKDEWAPTVTKYRVMVQTGFYGVETTHHYAIVFVPAQCTLNFTDIPISNQMVGFCPMWTNETTKGKSRLIPTE